MTLIASVSAHPMVSYSRQRELNMIGLGMVAILSQTLLPILLGHLGAAGLLSEAGIGEAAAIESYALTFTAAFAGIVLRARYLRGIGWASGAVLVSANLSVLWLTGEPQILAARAIAGIAEGLLFWIALEAVARSVLSERAAGLLNTGALVAGLMAANLMNFLLIPHFGIKGAFILLALMSGAAVLLSGWIPSTLAPTSASHEARTMPRPAGWLALLAVGLFNAAGMGFAIYIMPLAAKNHLSADVAGQALTALLVGQLAGSFLATVIAGRITPFVVLMISTAAYLMTWPLYATTVPAPTFIFLAGALGVITFWAFPFQFPFAAQMDPGTRTEVLTGPACMLGASTGPLLSAGVVDAYGLDGLLYLAFALLFLAVLLIVALHLSRRKRPGDRASIPTSRNLPKIS